MSHSSSSSLPNQLPILPLFDRSVLFPGLLLRLSVTNPASTAFLNHFLRSDQTSLVNLVLGCVPIRSDVGIGQVISEDGVSRLALPAPARTPPSQEEDSKPSTSEEEWGCSARIKSLSRLDGSYGTSGFVLVVEGLSTRNFHLSYRNFSISIGQNYSTVSLHRSCRHPFPR